MLERRDYQTEGTERLVTELLAGHNSLVVAPTGSGKSVILIDALLDTRLNGAALVVPSLEIALGIYEKLPGPGLGHDLRYVPEAQQRRALAANGIWTVKQLHNLMLRGDVVPPKFLLVDEAHHATDDTHTVLRAACGDVPMGGVTATPYRGTPEETKKLRDLWGEPWHAIRLRAAVERGVIARPDFRVWPLVNDDLITIRDGEFVLSQVEGAIEETLPALVQRVRDELTDGKRPLRPTMIRVPGVASARSVTAALRAAGLSAAAITGEGVDVAPDMADRRQDVFARVSAAETILVHVRVVGEGVDLPLRVLVDLAPTVSPVLWMQSVGRITRPVPAGDAPPTYVATNHNLTRHAYLWEGLIPPGQVRDAQKAWGEQWKPQRRHLARALGLEGFGRFAVSAVPLLDGSLASLYALQTKDGLHQYAVLLHPSIPEPLYFEKRNEYSGEKATFEKNGRTIEYKVKRYGPWRKVKDIPSAEGYVSVKPGPVTEDMLSFWQRAAKGRGLDGDAVPDWRQFQALPMLLETRTRFAEE